MDRSGIDFEAYAEIFAGPLVGVNPLRALSSLFKIGLGVLQSLVLLIRKRPQVILFTGGWANVPLAVAAWFLRVPMLVYLPDIEPGRTIQALGKIVQKVAITVPDSAQHFREGQTILTGYPLREAVTKATRDAAITHFGLSPDRKTILITGGSRGARSINMAVENIVPDLLQRADAQLIHVTGKLDWERSQENQPTGATPHYHPFPYLESDAMGKAFAAADIIIGRAGASVLGEFPYFGAASLLVPYPYAWRYQRTNADYLAKNGAAIRVDDEKMADELLPTLQTLLDDEAYLAQMQADVRAMNTGDGAENIAHALRQLAGKT